MFRLGRVLRLLKRPEHPERNRGNFYVLSVSPTHECPLSAWRTEAEAEQALDCAIEGFQRSGFALHCRGDWFAQMSYYLSELDIFVDTYLVVEYVASASQVSLPRQTLFALRRRLLSQSGTGTRSEMIARLN